MTEPNDLYGLPLERFVPERTALTRALRKDGHRAQAEAVASLRKPSVAAWAVNQLVRTHGAEVADLFAAGDALGHAQSELITGRGDTRAMREAVARERDAVSTLAQLARGLLSSEGHELTQTTLERVSESLHAAALDDEARAQVKDGCLTRELRYAGLGRGGLAGQPASSSGVRGERSPDAAAGAETKRIARERAERVEIARQAEADTRRSVQRAERELDTAQTRRDDMADALQKAEQALTEARDHADRAKFEHRRAQDALRKLS